MDTLIHFGSEMKVIGETADAWKVGGWAVVFDSFDKSALKDKFAADTDYDFENGEHRSLYYNHGLDGTIKKTRMGRVSLELKDAGVWYQGELKKRQDYLKEHAENIAQGIKDGAFGTSTGAPAHLVDRERVEGGHSVKLWPISEVSITPTPAEPMTSCVSLKSLQDAEAKTTMTTAAGIPPYPAASTDTVPIARRDNPTAATPPAEPTTIECTACGQQVPKDAEKCPFCASLLSRTGDETKHLTILEQGQLEGSRFADHSGRVLAAVTEFQERVNDLISDRSHSRKSGRVLSEDNYTRLSTHHTSLKDVVSDLGTMLDTHKPASAEADTKAIESEVLELELSFLQQYGSTAALA